MLTLPRIVTVASAIVATLLLIVCIPLMTQTMREDGVNCGTVFASSETWTYASTKNDPSSYYQGATSRSDLEAGTRAAVSDLMADLSRGASAYEYCEIRHSDRRTLLISLGSLVAVLSAVAVGSWWLGRRRKPSITPPAGT